MAFSKNAFLALLTLQTMITSAMAGLGYEFTFPNPINNRKETKGYLEVFSREEQILKILKLSGSITYGNVAISLGETRWEPKTINYHEKLKMTYPVKPLFTVPGDIPSLPAQVSIKLLATVRNETGNVYEARFLDTNNINLVSENVDTSGSSMTAYIRRTCRP